MTAPTRTLLRSGIVPLDERTGGLEAGGTYLVIGAPGPEKMVAALQFVHEGVRNGEPSLLLTNTTVDDMLGVASAWGFDLTEAWETGLLQVVGFRTDFELRAIRSIEPGEVLEEFEEIISPGRVRISVDPGSMFLTGGARTLLGSTFMSWARNHPATVLATFSVDGGTTSLPSSTDWLTQATTGRLLVEKRGDGLHQLTLSTAAPDADHREETISLELKPGSGLIEPRSYPARRGVDRGGIDENRLLLVSLGDEHASDLEAWARRAFETDVVAEPFAALAKVQEGNRYGGVLVHAPRRRVRDAVQACRAIRPLSRAAIVFASDDAVRSTDRVQILEAGADDCLSGGLDFRELGLRIKQAIVTGARPMTGSGVDRVESSLIPEGSDDGRVGRPEFIRQVERRAAEAHLAFFCVLDVRAEGLASERLEATLAEQVRADDGDIVSCAADRCAVLLQGAREGQIGPFLQRLRSRLAELVGVNGGAGVAIDVLSHPADSDRIMALLGTTNGEAG